MIELIRLNGEPLYVSYLQILTIEKIPETKVKLTTGDYYIVKNTLEDIEAQIVKFLHDVVIFKNLAATDEVH
ncbi:flagellar FlbD family protein [Oribacterium sp. WCC10]|uniref:flagellar FlbD family protein n=1 Tax=Oribacterium sp. WCC10 TaxID=1855343 RepID=UPI0008ED0062|nr:flagellar FlbD family protein [Oribacterium sp. WCC10]SFG25045.1 flagellar protein FlbD [Oribacterium sp. WCC10]